MTQVGGSLLALLQQLMRDAERGTKGGEYDVDIVAMVMGGSGFVRAFLAQHQGGELVSSDEREQIEGLLGELKETVKTPALILHDSARAEQFDAALERLTWL